ncbi:TetR/AcrR family transcriptional regulator [Actinomadura sp. WMMB 499]|uniref:TetR/AcrR family transcriptional regulator n=1 Tax=Actinomadura sp. WMMB 499 TaxID=1219491 RepID=UPI001C3FEBD6|nr:TetR/AcrR family transcriptional regulator C-terminal domain-containing protein [Actinomadura sp. WMMB 499]
MAKRHDPARPSRGRPPVPPDRIIDTALRILDEEGADALSMRALAQRLGSGTATLYRHFANRAALIAGLADHLFGQVAPGAGADWREAYGAIARDMFEVLSRHRNAAPLLVGEMALGPNAMALRERCLAILLDGGFPPGTAARAYTMLSRYVLGFAVQLAGASDRDGEAAASAAMRGADATLFPATAAVAGSLPVPIEEEFAFGLELLLDGLDTLRDGR